ncbi:unnamed protein product [Leptidea sinapis]|uniref:Uncharacterized protein n=1 Tax=Leptidea sinapis TaxID=189913 RepID=A0A5E4QZ15_9NEOP|nr:unnamed protein product [Leptidea sinapis]
MSCDKEYFPSLVHVSACSTKDSLVTQHDVDMTMDINPQQTEIQLPDGSVNTEESTISLFDAENNKKFISSTGSLGIGSILDTPRK